MKNHFTTGEFAKLCGVKKQTLFHYDDIDILKPDIRGENGYRYYSYKQLDEFAMISMLRDLDMPLGEIKEYLDKRSPDELVKLLEREEEQVKKKMDELKWVKHYINTKVEITKDAMETSYKRMLLVKCENELLITTLYEGSDDDEMNIAANFARHLNYCHDRDIYSAYSIGGLVPCDGVRNGEYGYKRLFTRLDEKGNFDMIKPAGTYLTYYNDEGDKNIEVVAESMVRYAEEQGFSTGEYFYEDWVLDSLSGKTWDDYVVRLSLKVDKNHI